jgi:hypothetical protein
MMEKHCLLAMFLDGGRIKKQWFQILETKCIFLHFSFWKANFVSAKRFSKGLIPRALFLGEMRIISPVSFELRLLE